MDSKVRFRRKQYIVKGGMQYRYIGVIFLFVIIVVAVTGGTIFYTAWAMFGEKLSRVYPQGQVSYIFRHINFILIRNLVLIVFPVIFVLAVNFSHKIAGPTVRIKSSIRELSKCNFDLVIKLRKGDEFKDVAESLNELASSLKTKRLELQETVKVLNADIDQLRQVLLKGPADMAALESALNRIKDTAQTIDKKFACLQQPLLSDQQQSTPIKSA